MAVFISSGRTRLRWIGLLAVSGLALQAGAAAAAESSRASEVVAYGPSLEVHQRWMLRLARARVIASRLPICSFMEGSHVA